MRLSLPPLKLHPAWRCSARARPAGPGSATQEAAFCASIKVDMESRTQTFAFQFASHRRLHFMLSLMFLGNLPDVIYRLRRRMPVYVDRLLDSNVPTQSQACMTPPCLLDSMFPSSTKHVPRHRVSRPGFSIMFLVGLPYVISKPTSMSPSRYHPVVWKDIGNSRYSMLFQLRLPHVISEPTA